MSYQDFSPELPVLASCEKVASRAALVFMHPEKIEAAVLKWGHLLDSENAWEHPCHFFDGTEKTARWIFTLDVLNHCFWPEAGKPAWTVRFGNEDYSGYWGLAASLKRAMEEGFPVTDPAWLSRIAESDLHSIFSYLPESEIKGTENLPPASGPLISENPETSAFLAHGSRIPLFSERLRNLREAGSVILSEHGGDIVSLLDKVERSAVRLVKSIVHHFPSFRDEAVYSGAPVFFWKRAQIFAADLHAAFSGKGLGQFKDIQALTAFADYKVPQVLRELGIISYRPELAEKIDGLSYLHSGSVEEVEIRAMTVVAVERIKESIRPESEYPVTSAEIDSWLWRLGQMDEFRKHPYHRCRTIFY